MRISRFILLICFLVIAHTEVWATHVMGGSVTYRYIGFNSVTSRYIYDISFEVYVDTGFTSSFPNGLNDLKFVIKDKSNNATLVSRDLGPADLAFNGVDPVTSPGCPPTALPNVDAGVNALVSRVELPFSVAGYFVIYEVCCRNGAIENINNPGSTGSSFFTEIPSPIFITPTGEANSSPQFFDEAVPAFCAGDTVTFVNTATDPDGDRLVYSFVTANDSKVAGTGNPTPTIFFLNTWTPPNIPITWAPSYGVNQPFGPGGFASINASTGLTRYYVPPGFIGSRQFVVTIEIKEFREIGGVSTQIGSTRRELQLIVKGDCPPNQNPTYDPEPIEDTTLGSPGFGVFPDTNAGDGRVYNITAGQQVKINYKLVDPAGDSVFIQASSEVLDGTNGYTGPLATFNDSTAKDSLSATFSWLTDCDVSGLFEVFINYGDKGCPPKELTDVYTINVSPFRAVDIVGDSVICDTTINYLYTLSDTTSFKKWEVSGGILLTDDSADQATIRWTDPANGQIRLIQSSGLGCIDTSTLTIGIFPSTPIRTIQDTFLCPGQSVLLTTQGNTTGTYNWSPSAGLSSSSIQNPIATPSATTTYIVTYVELGGCVLRDTVQVTVFDGESKLAGEDILICEGVDTTLGLDTSLTENYIFAWSPSFLFDDSTLQRPRFLGSIQAPGNYTLSLKAGFIQGGDTCFTVDTVSVDIQPLPSIDLGPDQVICDGDPLTFASILNPAPYTWNWEPAGLLSSTSGPSVNFVQPASIPSSGLDTFIVATATDALGCQSTDTLRIRINPLPGDSSALGNFSSLCLGSSLSLGAATPLPDVRYEWSSSLDSLIFSDSALFNPTLSVASGFSLADSLIIPVFLRLTDTLTGCTQLFSQNLVIYRLPDLVSANRQFQTCSGQPVSLDLSYLPSLQQANGFANAFAWSEDPSNPVLGVLSATSVEDPVFTATNTKVNLLDTFYFSVTITDTYSNCSQTFDSIQVVLVPEVIAEAGSDTLICAGTSFAIGSASIPGYSYAWSPATGLDNPNASQPIFTPTTSSSGITRFDLEVAAAFQGCLSTDSLTVLVYQAPLGLAGADTTICRDGNTLIGLDTALSGAYSFNWSPGSLLSDSTVLRPVFDASNLPAGTYQFVLEINFDSLGTNCTSFDTVDVILQEYPSIDLGPDQVICDGDPLTFASILNPAPYTWNWEPAGLLSSTSGPSVNFVQPASIPSSGLDTFIVATATDALGCQSTDTLLIRINPLPGDSSALGNFSSLCLGSSLSLGAATPLPDVRYEWSSSLDSLIFSDSALFNPTLSVASGFSLADSLIIPVFLRLTDTLTGCTQLFSQNLVIYRLPDLVSANKQFQTCSGQPVSLDLSYLPSLQQANGFANAFAWSEDPSNPVSGVLSATSVEDPVFTATNTKVNLIDTFYFSVTITDTYSNCSQTIDSIQVVLVPEVVNNPGKDTAICSGQSLVLGSPAISGYTYSWSPSVSLDDPTNAQPTFSSTAFNGQDSLLTYTLTTTFEGCSTTDSIQINLQARPSLPAAQGPTFVCPFVQGIVYKPDTLYPNLSYSWLVSGGSIVSPQGRDSIIINWGDVGVGTIILTVTDTVKGCVSIDRDTLVVNKNFQLKPQIAGPVGPQCLDTSASYTYTILNANPESSYQWFVGTNGRFMGSSTDLTVEVQFTDAGLTPIWVEETTITTDGINTFTCTGLSDTLEMENYALPNTELRFISNGNLCFEDDSTSLVVIENPISSSTYEWTIVGPGAITSSSPTQDSITIQWSSIGTATLFAKEINLNGCEGDSFSTTFNLFPSPPTAQIQGQDTICQTSSNSFTYTSTFDPSQGTTLFEIIGGTIIDTLPLSIEVVWNLDSMEHRIIARNQNTISGCIGDTFTTSITVDRRRPLLNHVSLQARSDSLVNIIYDFQEISFSPFEATIERNITGSDQWNPIATVTTSQGEYTDAFTSVLSEQYNYRIAARNFCGDLIYSDTMSTILLKGVANESANLSELSWLPLTINGNEERSYEVFRQLDNQGFSFYQAASTSTFQENYENAGDGFEQCYFLATNNTLNGDTAYSNPVCLTFSNELEVPNVFTPNGDGINDNWELGKLSLYPNTEVHIYNRWGKEVFSSSSYDNSFSADGIEAGVYFFTILRGSGNNREEFTGMLTILR